MITGETGFGGLRSLTADMLRRLTGTSTELPGLTPRACRFHPKVPDTSFSKRTGRPLGFFFLNRFPAFLDFFWPDSVDAKRVTWTETSILHLYGRI